MYLTIQPRLYIGDRSDEVNMGGEIVFRVLLFCPI